MDITRLYMDYNVPFVTDGHKHTRPGWVNTSCPFCAGNFGYHLGFHIQDEYFVCWRCGGHSTIKTLMELLRLSYHEVKTLLNQYGSTRITTIDTAKVEMVPFKYPCGVVDLQNNHRKYLINRGFDPDQLIQDWQIQGTGAISKLDGVDYKLRIFIPVLWKGEVVTFLCRSINERCEMRYLVCPEAREKINIKETLYMQPNPSELGIVVEGCTDVWRLGSKAVGLYGIKYKSKQVRLLAQTFKRCPVVFDADPQAQKQAKKLVAELRFRGVDSWLVRIDGDPGSMTQDDSDAFVRELCTYKIK